MGHLVRFIVIQCSADSTIPANQRILIAIITSPHYKPCMVDEPVNLSDTVASTAQGPKRVSVAGMGDSEEFPLSDKIAAAKFMPNATVRARVGAGIKFTKATAGGAS
jgi:hypothetical protein